MRHHISAEWQSRCTFPAWQLLNHSLTMPAINQYTPAHTDVSFHFSMFRLRFYFFVLICFFLSFGKIYFSLTFSGNVHVGCVCLSVFFQFICSLLFFFCCCFSMKHWTARRALSFVLAVVFFFSHSFHNNSLCRFHDVLFVPKPYPCSMHTPKTIEDR